MPTARRAAFLYTDEFLSYDLGPQHPLKPGRLRMVYELLNAYGVLAPSGPVALLEPPPATEEQIRRVHTAGFVDAVKRASACERGDFLHGYGLGPGDTPAFDGMYEAAALYAGGTVEAARLVLSGEYDAVFNVAGGVQHHAHPDHASGFGTFNDLAIGIHELLNNGLSRVAYIDIDVHHGDGVQACFYDDPRVLTISLHESGRYLYPGTGFPDETGAGAAAGTSINVPFFPYTLDDVWHNAFDRVVPSAVARFRPEAIMIQVGADAHWQDPLAHVLLTANGWLRTVDKLLALSEGLPLVITGGGGYNVKTVARLWTQVQARVAGLTLPNEVPAAYAERYGISQLDDDAEPQVEPKVQEEARRYMETQVARLEEVLAETRT
jgi:acetoin utilization protein AcuC